MPRKIGAALVAVALPFVACGGQSAQSDSRQIESASAEFASSLGSGQYERACGVTTDPANCVRQLAMARKFVGESYLRNAVAQTKLVSVNLAPDKQTATVRYSGAGGRVSRFVKRDGKWRMVAENWIGSSS